MQNRHQEVHKRNLSIAKTKIRNKWSDREEERIAASRRNVKREQVIEDRYNNIERENLRILVRMQEIEHRGPAKAAASLALAGSASVRASSSLPPPGAGSKATQRVKELRRIDSENQRMLKRLQTVKGSVDRSQTEKQFKHQQKIMRMGMQNPNEVRMSEVRQANRSLLPPRLPTPDPAMDEEVERLIRLRDSLLGKVEEPVEDLAATHPDDGGDNEMMRRSRSCGSTFGSRQVSRQGSREGSRPPTGQQQRTPAARARSPLTKFSAGVIPQNSKDIVEALFAAHQREEREEEDLDDDAEDAKDAAARALRDAQAIDVAGGDEILSYGNLVARGREAYKHAGSDW